MGLLLCAVGARDALALVPSALVALVVATVVSSLAYRQALLLQHWPDALRSATGRCFGRWALAL
jgi:hypothetical protein